MSIAEAETASLLDQPHHDGSELYVLARPDAIGGEAVVRARIPVDVDSVVLRYVEDGEARGVSAERDGDWRMTAADPPRSAIIASEPLTTDHSTWLEVPEYSIVTAERDGEALELAVRDLDV